MDVGVTDDVLNGIPIEESSSEAEEEEEEPIEGTLFSFLMRWKEGTTITSLIIEHHVIT